MTIRSKTLTLLASALLTALCSCMNDTKHLAFAPIGLDGWGHTDTLTYTIAPMTGMHKGGVYLLLHTEGYDYANIALDICIHQDTVMLYHEQRSYLLAQCESKNGIGHRCDYTLPVGNIELCDTLPTTITLTQALDQPTLTGIREIGIRMTAPMRLPGDPVWRFHW